MSRYYKQPEFMGGKKVFAKEVPSSFYSIFFINSNPSATFELEVMKHENSFNRTKEEINSMFNTYSTKERAKKALTRTKKALSAKYDR
jgi:hypothetical protein